MKIFILFFIIATLGLTLVACSVSADVPDRHTIIFYVGDDYYANIRTRGCEIITLPSDPTLDGYVFYGWYKEKVFSNEVTETTYEDTYLEEDQNVYAKFIDASLVASSYTVSFETNGGSSVDDYTCTFRSRITSNITTERPGYEFTGWYLDEDLTSEVNITYYRVRGNVTLYAGWEKSKFKITYELDGGASSANNVTELDPEETLTLEDPTKSGYSFLGWYLDSDFTEAFVNGSLLTTDITLYAKWEIITYTIEFTVPDGATFDDGGLTTFTVEDDLVIEDPSMLGYTFQGWFLDSDYQNLYYSTQKYAQNLHLYAWLKETEFTITYHLEDDAVNNSNNPSTYKYFGSLIVYEPTRPGYLFDTWYMNSSHTIVFETSTSYSDGNSYLSDIDLYPTWTLETYTIAYHNVDDADVTFNDGGLTSFTIEDELNLSSPTKSGYVFVCWYLDASFTTKFSSSTKYTYNLDLYAKFVASELLDPSSYIEMIDVPSLYFESGSSLNLCINFEEDTFVSAVTINGDALDGTSDEFVSYENYLVIANSAFNGMSEGRKYPIILTTDDGDLLYYVTIVDELSYTFTATDFSKFDDSEITLTSDTTFTSSNILGVAIDDEDVEYAVASTTTIIIDDDIMNEYSVGYHVVRIYTTLGISSVRILVTNGTVLYPYNVKVDVDNSWPDVYIRWDCDATVDYYIVTIDSVNYASNNATYASLFSDTSFNASSYIYTSGQTVSVTASISGVDYTSSSVSTTLNLYTTSSLLSKVSGVSKILDSTFTVYGKTENFYFESWEELYDFIFYTYLYRDTVNGTTMVFTIDFDINEAFNAGYIDYSRKYYNNVTNYSIDDATFVMALCQEVCYCLPEAAAYSINFSKNTTYNFYSNQTYNITLTYNGDMCPDNSTHVSNTSYASNYDNTDSIFTHYGSGITSSSYEFPIEKNNNGSVTVNSSIELYMALENGYLPTSFGTTALSNLYEEIKTVLKGILDEDMNDYEIVLAIYDWICANVVYDYASVSEASSYSGTTAYYDVYGWSCFYMEGVFSSDHLAVCNGISAAMSAMCNIMGIECHKLTGLAGSSSASGEHAWVEVCIGGNWYYSDPTWGNCAISSISREITTYSYFLMTTLENENGTSRKTTTKPTPFGIHYANDTEINIYRNIPFVYNSVEYDHEIASTSEAKELIKAVVKQGESRMSSLTSGIMYSTVFVGTSSFAVSTSIKSYSSYTITYSKFSTSSGFLTYDGGTVYIMIITRQ